MKAAKKSLTPEEQALVREIHTLALQGKDTTGMEDPSAKAAALGYALVRKIRAHLGGRLIRRTGQSRRFDGKPIQEDLPGLVRHNLIFKLPEEEMANLDIALAAMGEA